MHSALHTLLLIGQRPFITAAHADHHVSDQKFKIVSCLLAAISRSGQLILVNCTLRPDGARTAAGPAGGVAG